jgi:hypothetical protein
VKLATVVFVCFLLVSLLVPFLVVYGQPAFLPHEDPAAAESSLDAFSFLSQYVEVLGLISSEQYDNASALAEQLSMISVPADLTYIVNRFSNLTQELIGVLGDLRGSLDNASALLDQYRLVEAGLALNASGVLVTKAQILLGDLHDATGVLSQSLGVFAAPAESKIRQAYSELDGLLQRLDDLVNEYHALMQSISKQAADIEIQHLSPTSLTLVLNSTSGFVGDFLAASGELTSGGLRLGGRSVVLMVDGKPVATATTGADGGYSSKVQVPYRYVHSMVLQVLYAPVGDDKGVYLASSSSVSVEVQFFETFLNVSCPGEGYPGLPLGVSGKVFSSSDVSLGGRDVRVSFDGGFVGDVKTDAAGEFQVQFVLSSSIGVGVKKVGFVVNSNGVYSSISRQVTVSVVKLASSIEVEVPSFVLLPAEIQVKGTASSALGPLRDAGVTLTLASVSVETKSLEDGSFSATLSVPLSAVFAGGQDLNVTVVPSEPWQAAVQTEASVFVISSANVGFASAAFVSIGVVFYVRFVKPKSRRAKEEIVVVPEAEPFAVEESPVSVSLKPKLRFKGPKGSVLRAYSEGLRAVESVSGSSLKASMTLREYLQEAKLLSAEILGAFAELTFLAERALYSPHIPDRKEVKETEILAAKIQEDLKR